MRKFNYIQTEINAEILDKMPREEKQDLLDSIDSIQFIQNLSNPKRKYAKDLAWPRAGPLSISRARR